MMKNKQEFISKQSVGLMALFALICGNKEGRLRKSRNRNLKAIMREHVDSTAEIMTDEFPAYKGVGKEFSSHKVINHGNKEYVNGDVYTNTTEGYFSL